MKKIKNLKGKIKRRFVLKYISLGINFKKTRLLKESVFNGKMYNYLEKKYRKKLYKLPDYSKKPKTNSNKVWWCWFQGEENAPELIKSCLASIRKNLKDREIIVITMDNYKDYVDFPDYIIEKVEKGIISLTHFSDLLRLQLLIKYGGTWIDSSVYCTKYNPNFFDKDLFVFKSFMREDDSMLSSSWFITSCTNNTILSTTRDLLFEYWKHHDYLIHYYLFHFFFKMACQKYNDLYYAIPNYPNVVPHILQFELLNEFSKERFEEIKEMASIHKLTYKLNLKNKKSNNTFYDYLIKLEKGENKNENKNISKKNKI